MNNQPLHNKFFTEENSPLPLIPTDQAWEAMQAKLNSQFPEKKRRRMITWLPPVGCALLLLLLGGGYALWQYTTPKQMTETPGQAKQTTGKEKTSSFTQETNDTQTPTSNTQPTPTPSLQPATTSLTAKTTSTNKRKPQPNKALAGTTTNRNGTPELLKKEQHKVNATFFRSSLRPSPVAGIQYAASIHVQPARPPKSLWLPDESTWITDSSGNKPAPKYVFAIGLQAEIPVPIYTPDVYFKNPEGKDRFYQPFSPDIWAGVTKKRHRLTAEFKPFASALLPYKPFHNGAIRLPDSTTYWGQHTVVKVFGAQLALQYTYQVRKQWWAGVGLDLSKWRKALIQVDSFSNKPLFYGVHKNDASYLNATQLGAVLHLNYESTKAWTGTLQIETPFKPTVKGGPLPVWVRLGLRWRLLQSRNTPIITTTSVIRKTLP
ncbi:MAG: hypothetical protein J7621_10835 [Niastella sp.]|nr:hypothetical protein [Niastella sp.]